MTTTMLREQDIRPAALMADKQSCIEHDVAFLLAARGAWVEVGCPACESTARARFGAKRGFGYQSCTSCGTVYTSPRPDAALLERFYGESQNYAYWNEHIFPKTEAARRERIFRPRAQRLAALCRQHLPRLCAGTASEGAAFLEVGAGFGTFCDEVRATGLFSRLIAVEPTPGLASTCRSRGIETIESVVEHLTLDIKVDVVAAFEVIEHLFDPASFIRTSAALLKPGGLLLLSCPNVKGFAISSLGVASGSFDHEHLNYFHPRSLSHLAERCGLEVLETLTPGELDADIVRRHALDGSLDLSGSPFLQEVLIDRWDELGGPFQKFLAQHSLSSHLWLVAKMPGG
jgi:SAM-dependent methyltransferase